MSQLPSDHHRPGMRQVQGFLLVDDHALIRDGMSLAIRQLQPEAHLVEADSCAQAVRALQSDGQNIDVVLLDLDLPDSHGLDTLQRVRAACTTQRVAIFTGHCDGQLALACIHHGAVCFIPKLAGVADFQAGLHAVLGGRLFLPPALLAAASAAAQDQDAPAPAPTPSSQPAPQLSPRQHEVLALLLRGCTNQAIAQALSISPDTAKMHVSAILRAHQVATRTQLVLRYAAGSHPGPATASEPRAYPAP